jgi:hypothetical protein
MSFNIAETAAAAVRSLAQEPAVPPPCPPLPLRHRPVWILQPTRAVPLPAPPLTGMRVTAGKLEAAVTVRQSVSVQLAPVAPAVQLTAPPQTLHASSCYNARFHLAT